jgi:3-methyladenine DNA glycosylase AlkD
MVSSEDFVIQGDSYVSLAFADLLLNDDEDLMHKAAGLPLREVGKKCSLAELRGFLKLHAATMPRTMLRYSIEKLEPEERKKWLNA